MSTTVKRKLPKGLPAADAPDEEWRTYYRQHVGGKKAWRAFADPVAIMRPKDVAKVIGVTEGAIYHYRRYGNIPIPDLQEGGRKPRPGELIVWRGKRVERARTGGQTLYPTAKGRLPRAGELIKPHRVGWFAWRIYRWSMVERKGRGWHDSGADRVPLAERSHDIGPGEWLPPPANAKKLVLGPPREDDVE